jgi:hypothetical protein
MTRRSTLPVPETRLLAIILGTNDPTADKLKRRSFIESQNAGDTPSDFHAGGDRLQP